MPAEEVRAGLPGVVTTGSVANLWCERLTVEIVERGEAVRLGRLALHGLCGGKQRSGVMPLSGRNKALVNSGE